MGREGGGLEIRGEGYVASGGLGKRATLRQGRLFGAPRKKGDFLSQGQ